MASLVFSRSQAVFIGAYMPCAASPTSTVAPSPATSRSQASASEAPPLMAKRSSAPTITARLR